MTIHRNSEDIRKTEEQVECLDISAMLGAITTGREGVRKIHWLELKVQHCPKPEILSLHVISSMPEPVK